jgi:hypothetical protein
VLGKNTHQHGESLDALAEPLAPERPTPVELPMKRLTILLRDFGSHKQKNLVIFICRVENVLKFDGAVYPTGRDQMMFAKQYLVSNTATALDQYCA